MRIIAITTIGLIMAAGSFANQFQIGGATGLTSTYVASGCATANGPSFAGCVTGGSSTYGSGSKVFGERSYIGQLFDGATVGGANPTYPASGSVQSTTDPFGSGTVNFNMINDAPVGGLPANAWVATGNASSSGTLTIPVGIYAPTEAFTMLQNLWGLVGTSTIEVSFNFGSSSNVINAAETQNYFLTNGVEVRSGIDCASPPACPTTIGATLGASSYSNVASANVWDTIYNGITPSTGTPPAGGSKAAAGSPFYSAGGSSGTLNLDAQAFNFGGALTNQYLVDVVITDMGGNTNISRTAVSALTIETAPEPGTVLLALAGLGALGAARFRRKKA